MTIKNKTSADIALPMIQTPCSQAASPPDVDGPSVVAIRNKQVFDVTKTFATMRDLCEHDHPAGALKAAKGELIGTIEDLLSNTPVELREFGSPLVLAPIDLQAVKAAGVTFVTSMLERVIEERARGNPQAANEIRSKIGDNDFTGRSILDAGGTSSIGMAIANGFATAGAAVFAAGLDRVRAGL